jgi:hypothetical protein
MRNYFDSDVRHALEVLGKASTGVRLEAACMLLRQSAIDSSIGVVGRGFLRESESGLQAVVDWIEVGDREALKETKLEEMETEVSL